MHVLYQISPARIRSLLFLTLVISPECRVHGFLGGNGLGGIDGFGVIDTVIGIGKEFTESPSSLPSDVPTFKPSATPSTDPSLTPTLIPTTEPSEQPSIPPSTAPTLLPSSSPSFYPTDMPSRKPSVSPSRSPSLIPSKIPSSSPSTVPTWKPSSLPSEVPSDKPTNQPSSTPSLSPTLLPTSYPSRTPSMSPSVYHSDSPSDRPSLIPSKGPSLVPSAPPSSQPTTIPSSLPSSQPTLSPSSQPTLSPSTTPSLIPTELPTTSPSSRPTLLPTVLPSSSPTVIPTIEPTFIPSQKPSKEPTPSPSIVPSSRPSAEPSMVPTLWHSHQPSSKPSTYPSINPTMSPLAFSFESVIIIANTDGILDDEEKAAFERENLVRGRHANCDIMSDVRLESVAIQSQGINVEDTFIVIRINTKGYLLTPKSSQNENIVIKCVEDAYRYETSEINKGASPDAIAATATTRSENLTMIIVASLVCVLAVIALLLYQRSRPRRRVTTEIDEAVYEDSVVASVADLSYCDEDLLDIFALDNESKSLAPNGHGRCDKIPSTPDDASNDISQETSSVSNLRDMPSLFKESLALSVATTPPDDKRSKSGASINIGASDEEEMIFYEQSSTHRDTDEERPQRDGRSNIPFIMKELETMLHSSSGDGNTLQRDKRAMQRNVSSPPIPPDSKVTPEIIVGNASISADSGSVSAESSGIGNEYGLSLDQSLTSLQPDVFVQKLTDSQSVVSSAIEGMQPGQLFSNSNVASLSPSKVKRAEGYFSDASSASTFDPELANRYNQRQREADEFSQSTGYYTKSTYNPTSTAPNLDSIANIDSLSHSVDSTEREEHSVFSDSPIVIDCFPMR